MGVLVFRLVVLCLAALSFAPSFAHVLEAPVRLAWKPELWIATTVTGGLYAMFGAIGGTIDVLTTLSMFGLAWVTRRRRAAFEFCLLAAILFAGSIAIWMTVVMPANAVMATWRAGRVPTDFEGVRRLWESGHMAVCGLKAAGLVLLYLSVLWETLRFRGNGGVVRT